MPSSYSPLPLLNDDELTAFFGTDEDAIRRYRIIHAVLMCGAAQREAAHTAGVSERTVRNVLQLYRREGVIERLRSRSGGPSRRVSLQRAALYEPALATVLAEAPDAGGDRLWRQACVMLGTEASGLSRRTAYRILAQLRAEREHTADQSEAISELRAALVLLPEDPPLSLGASALALRLLGEEAEPVRRGALLGQILSLAIDRLRPASDLVPAERGWWPYLIAQGEYERSRSRAELQTELALSPSTYSRAKRRALAQIQAVLPDCLIQATAAPHHRASQVLPRAADFVGRHAEQAYYSWRLQVDGIAYVWGLPGCGKTALAAEVAAEARRYGQRIIWHSCESPILAQPTAIVRSLINSQATSDTAAELPQELTDLLGIFGASLDATPTLVVIDDAQRIDAADGALLIPRLQNLGVRVLVVGTTPPVDSSWTALRGLESDEAYAIVSDSMPTGTLWQALYAASGGFPQPLQLVAAAARRASTVSQSEDWYKTVQRWATSTIWQQLLPVERRLLAAVHGMVGQMWAAQHQCIIDVLEIDAAVLAALLRNSLLVPDQQQFRVHPLVEGPAAAAFEGDADLQMHCLTFADCSECIALPQVAGVTLPPANVVQSAEGNHSAELVLMDRLRAVLDQSAAYLSQGVDPAALTLAGELTRLQAALPLPLWRRS